MKVEVKEEQAWKRVLEVSVDADTVSTEMDRVVEEYRRNLSLPGFRKGKVPGDIIKKRMGDDLEGEVLRRVVPKAFQDALAETEIQPIGEPKISNLRFTPGEPLRFTATLEVRPAIEVTGYQGLSLTREQRPVTDEHLNQVLDNLREENAELEEVDRPAQNKDVVKIRYHEISEEGKPAGDGEPVEMELEVGGEKTPDSFNEALFGAVVGDMKKVPLSYPPDYHDAELAGKTRTFHVTVVEVKEKIWPALEDPFAVKVLGKEDATMEDLKSRIRLNLEMEARVQSQRELENRLLGRLLELNPFDLPRDTVEASVDRLMERVREENPGIPPDEEVKVREHYRTRMENEYRVDLLLEAVGKQEQIEVTDEDLNKEIAGFAEKEGEEPARVRARLKKEGGLERLRDDLYRRRVVDRLVELADVTVAGGETPGEGEDDS